MNKGFTLVELLAVIIILALLAVLTSTSITKVVKNSKEDLSSSQIKLIESAAKNWAAENMNKLPEAGQCKYLTLNNLNEYGYISDDIIDPSTNKNINKDLKIKISSKLSKYGKDVITYEVDSNKTEGCPHASPCTLVSGEEDIIGSKYECEVKLGMKYHFYVLSHEADGTTNLIMDQNIYSDGTPAGMNGVTQNENSNKYSLVAWNSSGSTDEGPVDAMNYLYNATKDWININPINNELFGLNFGTSTKPLRARMPIYSAIWNIVDGSAENKISEDGELSDKKANNSNAYLYENLSSNGITPPIGYWTLSIGEQYSYVVWVLISDHITHFMPEEYNIIGVRPVINVNL